MRYSKETRTRMAKGSFNRSRKMFSAPINKNFLRILWKCHVWSVALQGAEARNLSEINRGYGGNGRENKKYKLL